MEEHINYSQNSGEASCAQFQDYFSISMSNHIVSLWYKEKEGSKSPQAWKANALAYCSPILTNTIIWWN